MTDEEIEHLKTCLKDGYLVFWRKDRGEYAAIKSIGIALKVKGEDPEPSEVGYLDIQGICPHIALYNVEIEDILIAKKVDLTADNPVLSYD